MRDQYEDGRYGGVPDEDYGYYYPDAICAPPFQQFAASVLSGTGIRGGIRYPKGNTTAMSDVTKQLKEAREQSQKLTALIAELERKAKAEEIPPAPLSRDGDAFSFKVRFGPQGTKIYRYLVLRTADGRWFTTGTQDGDKSFCSWADFYRWLRTDKTWHSAVTALETYPRKEVVQAWWKS